MRRPIFTGLLLSAALTAAAELGPYAGNPVPPVAQILDLGGQPHSLSDYRGKVVLLNFWASWCGPCITEIPGIRALRERLDGEPFEVLAVNVGEGPFKVHKFTKLVPMPFPILLDEDQQMFDAWEAQVLPTSYLLDATGEIRYRVQGPMDWASDDAVGTVRSLLPDRPAP